MPVWRCWKYYRMSRSGISWPILKLDGPVLCHQTKLPISNNCGGIVKGPSRTRICYSLMIGTYLYSSSIAQTIIHLFVWCRYQIPPNPKIKNFCIHSLLLCSVVCCCITICMNLYPPTIHYSNWGDHCARVHKALGVITQKTPHGLQWTEFLQGLEKYQQAHSPVR